MTLWLLRCGWLTLPLTLGGAVAEAAADLDRPLALVLAVELWSVWAVLVVATLVPHPLGLTGLRVAAPAAMGVALWAAVVDGWTGTTVLAAGASVVTGMLVFLPAVAEQFVDAVSYGDERRLPLRVPGTLWLGPVELAWLVAVAGPVAGPLLLGGGQWVAGAVVVVVGLPAAVLALRSIYSLTRRFLVFVPNGVVLHDHLALTDPFLFGRSRLVRIGPARRGTGALDLTKGALGLAVEIRLDGEVSLPVAVGSDAVETVTDAVLVTPSRPASALAEAERRRLPVGA